MSVDRLTRRVCARLVRSLMAAPGAKAGYCRIDARLRESGAAVAAAHRPPRQGDRARGQCRRTTPRDAAWLPARQLYAAIAARPAARTQALPAQIASGLRHHLTGTRSRFCRTRWTRTHSAAACRRARPPAGIGTGGGGASRIRRVLTAYRVDAADASDTHLTIFGEGPEREIDSQIDALGLASASRSRASVRCSRADRGRGCVGAAVALGGPAECGA